MSNTSTDLLVCNEEAELLSAEERTLPLPGLEEFVETKSKHPRYTVGTCKECGAENVNLCSGSCNPCRRRVYLSEGKCKYCGNYVDNLSCGQCNTCLKRRQKFGLEFTDIQQLFEIQKGKCLGCEHNLDIHDSYTCIDHCHETEIIRGLLCKQCNTAAGQMRNAVTGEKRDSARTAANLEKYLSGYRPSKYWWRPLESASIDPFKPFPYEANLPPLPEPEFEPKPQQERYF